jgi:hypothetical protein
MSTAKAARSAKTGAAPARAGKRRPSAQEREVAELMERIDRKLDDLLAKSNDLLRDLDTRRGA